jgi:hypothetical protein
MNRNPMQREDKLYFIGVPIQLKYWLKADDAYSTLVQRIKSRLSDSD